MHLIDDWKLVLKKAWSIRLILLAGFFSGLESGMQIAMALHWLDEYPIPPGVLAFTGFILGNAAFIARILAQQSVSNGKQ